jgi:hypothetical protein
MLPDAVDNPDWISGDWHLVDARTPDAEIPQHRVDIRLDARHGRLQGAVLNRANGEEMLLDAAVLDGAVLRLRMASPTGRLDEAPWLVMERVGSRFEGRWEHPGLPYAGPRLKLVRAAGSR